MDWVKKNFSNKRYRFFFLLNKCSDNTENLIKYNFNSYPYKIIKSSSKNRGSGLNLAFRKLNKKTKYFAICSVDNAWSFNFYLRAYKKLEKNDFDVIYGPKSHKNSKVKTNLKRKIISFLSKIYLLFLFGNKINQDTQCIKLFKANIKFLKKLSNYNYFSETEFYLISKMYKTKFLNMSVKVNNDIKNSKVNILKVISYIFESLHFKIKYLKF